MFRNGRTHEARSFTANNQQQTVQVPTGGKITSLMVRFVNSSGANITEAQVRSEVANIRLSINGTDIVNCDGNAIYDAYEMLGVRVGENAGTNGAIELNLGSLVFTDPALGEAYGFGTADVSSIQVQVTCGTLTALAGMQVFTERLVEKVPSNLGRHCRFIAYPRNYASAGEDTLDTLPRDINSGYLAVMMKPDATGVISHGELGVNSNTLIERRPISMNALTLSNKQLSQPSGYFVYNAIDGLESGVIPMLGVQDLRFKTTFSTANTSGYTAYALTVNNLPVVTQ